MAQDAAGQCHTNEAYNINQHHVIIYTVTFPSKANVFMTLSGEDLPTPSLHIPAPRYGPGPSFKCKTDFSAHITVL